MKTYPKQWRTLNTSWPDEGDVIHIIYEAPEDEGKVIRNVNFTVDRYGNGTFIKVRTEFSEDYITGWKYAQE